MGVKDKKGRWRPWYIQTFSDVVKKTYASSSKPPSILGLGLGVGMISYLSISDQIDYVELDEDVIKIAQDYLDLPKAHRCFHMSAETYLQHHSRSQTYDVIFHDVFIGSTTYTNLFQPKYLSKIKKILTPNGVLIINCIDYKKVARSYTKYFADYELLSQTPWLPLKQNRIICVKKNCIQIP